MKLNKLIVSAFFLAALSACNQQANNKTSDAADTTAAVTPAASAGDTAAAIALISDFYNSYLFGDKEFQYGINDNPFFSEKLARKLKNEYEKEFGAVGEGDNFAIWHFLSGAETTSVDDGLKGVRRSGENLYSASFVDGGVNAVADIIMVMENGAYKMDAVSVSSDKKFDCNTCNDTHTVTCPNCGGDGFIEKPDGIHDNDQGVGCTNCYGGGYGSRRMKSPTLKIGKGKIPCPDCVKIINVDDIVSTVGCETVKPSAAFEKKLLGRHGMRLQWISDSKLGAVNISKINDEEFKCVGEQRSDTNDDYITIDGKLRVQDEKNLVFIGKIIIYVHHIHHGIPYQREGVMMFSNTKNRKFWRLQEMDNGDCTDYVDIFMEPEAVASAPAQKTIAFITEYYNKHVFQGGSGEGDESPYLTKRLIKQLKKEHADMYDNECGGKCYDTGIFKNYVDGWKEGDGLKKVYKKADNLFAADYAVAGRKETSILTLAYEDGAFKIDQVSGAE